MQSNQCCTGASSASSLACDATIVTNHAETSNAITTALRAAIVSG
jgi:hypothetical protein